MSFLTAILGGLGGYSAGRQQRQQFNSQQQQYNQAEADRQRALGMDEAKYREAARQVLANRGTDPNTARWNPATFQYEGGTPFQMPKGWETVPKDPSQAAAHFMRLLNIYSGQDRGQSDAAQIALGGYNTAQAQQTELQKYHQQESLEERKFGQSVWLENIKANYAQQGRQYEAGQALYREELSEGDRDRINMGDHLFQTWLRGQPDAAMIYGAQMKTPQAALDLASKGLSNLPGQITTAIDGLTKDNLTFMNKNPTNPQGMPNPNNRDFGNNFWVMYHQVVANPQLLGKTLDAIKASNDAYDKGQTDPKTGARVGMSDTQAAVASNWLQKAATTKNAVLGSQNALKVIQKHALGGMYGGSYDSRNPTASGSAIPPPAIWEMLVQNGATPDEATKLTAIAMAESGGDPTSVNTHDPLGNGKFQHAWGLFQLGNGTNDPNAYPGWQDPQKNIQYALAKLRSRQGWRAWGTYNSGAYKRFMPAGVTS